MNFTELFGKMSIAAMLAGSIWSIFKALEEAASGDAKEALRHWLQDLDLVGDRTGLVSDALYKAYLSFFGYNVFSRKFILRSIQLSLAGSFIVVVCVIGAIAVAIDFNPSNGGLVIEWLPNFLRGGLVELAIFSLMFVLVGAGFIVVPVFFGCLVADYISLIKSYLILRYAHESKQYKRAFLYDFLTSALLGFGWILLVATISFAEYFLRKEGGPSITLEIWKLLGFGIVAIPITAFIPTAFIAAMILASYFAKCVQIAAKPIDFLRRRVLSVNERPFVSVGAICAVASIPVSLSVLTLF